MKNYIIVALALLLVAVIADNIHKSERLEKLNILESFGAEVAEWDDGSKLLFINGGNYEIGLAKDKDGKLFWNNITKLDDFFHGRIGALGYCKDGKLAARPAGCFEEPLFTSQPTMIRHLNLFN